MSINNTIGYIICETASINEPVKPVIKEEVNGKVTIETILQDADVKNRNGRIYSGSSLKSKIENCSRLKELISNNSLLGECCHPLETNINRQGQIMIDRTSHYINKIWYDSSTKKVMGLLRGTPNQFGEMFNNFILDGMRVAFSLRALGSVKNTSKGAEVDISKIITYDWVIYPSHSSAYMTNILSESSCSCSPYDFRINPNPDGIITPITNKSVIDYIKNESTNLKTISESFDVLYETIQIDNGKVKLKDKDNNTFVVYIENYIQDEILEYCSSYYNWYK